MTHTMAPAHVYPGSGERAQDERAQENQSEACPKNPTSLKANFFTEVLVSLYLSLDPLSQTP